MAAVPMTSPLRPQKPCGRSQPRKSGRLLCPRSMLAGSLQAESSEAAKRFVNLAIGKARRRHLRSAAANGRRWQNVSLKKTVDMLDRNGPARRLQRPRQTLSWWDRGRGGGNIGASCRRQLPDHAMRTVMLQAERRTKCEHGRGESFHHLYRGRPPAVAVGQRQKRMKEEANLR